MVLENFRLFRPWPDGFWHFNKVSILFYSIRQGQLQEQRDFLNTKYRERVNQRHFGEKKIKREP